MPTVTLDGFGSESQLIRHAIRGYTSTRWAMVEGLTGTPEQMKIAAINSQDDGMPAINSRHPDISKLQLSVMTATSLGKNNIKVRLDYVQFQGSRALGDPATTTISGGVLQEENNLNKDGEAQFTIPTEGAPNKDRHSGVFSIYLPQVSISLSRKSSTDPLNDALTYVGTVNSVAWNVAPISGPRTWLCTLIRGVSNDNNQTFQVQYEFLHATGRRTPTGETEPKWDAYIVHLNLESGQPAFPDEPGFNSKSVQFYQETDFNVLRLAPGDR